MNPHSVAMILGALLAGPPALAQPLKGPIPADSWGAHVYCYQVYRSVRTQFRLYFSGPEDYSAPTNKPLDSALSTASRAIAQASIKATSQRTWADATLMPPYHTIVFSDVAAEVAACDRRFGFAVLQSMPPLKQPAVRPKGTLKGIDPRKLGCDEITTARDAFWGELLWVQSQRVIRMNTDFQSDLMTSGQALGMGSAINATINNLNRTAACAAKIEPMDLGWGYTTLFPSVLK